MATKTKHEVRSHRNYDNYKVFHSKDKANHGSVMNPIFKDHPKKYDGKGHRINV